MTSRQHPTTPQGGDRGLSICPKSRGSRRQSFLRLWFLANSLVAGVLALLWLLLRSGSKPSRLAYPCQQAAISTAGLAFAVPLISALLAARQRLATWLRRPAGVAGAAAAVLLAAGLWGYFSRADEYSGPRGTPDPDYRAAVFHVTDCPQDRVGGHFPGLDNVIRLMASQGVRFYQSENTGPDGQVQESGPDGLFAADDVILIKINYQWPERGGTNTDLLHGVIQRLIEHPDGFHGEIVVVENAQFNSTSGFDRSSNNAQDAGQSPYDVVMSFRNEGHAVSLFDFTPKRYTSVTEYRAGDMADGYVLSGYDADLHGKISCPKFLTDDGTYISMRFGVYSPDTNRYNSDKLKVVNLPVLKSHHATYGMTGCIKHYMGVVTRELGTGSHSAIRYGLLGALMAESKPPTLNILDCIWINANPNGGPWTTYEEATRLDQLVAGTDPVAIDMWAAKNILIPTFYANGYSPPWPSPSADPDDPSSPFRTYLDASMNYLLAAGYDVTNDPSQIDAFTWDGQMADGDADDDGVTDAADYAYFADCLAGPGPSPAPMLLSREGCLATFDADLDGDIDLADAANFQRQPTPTD